MTPPINLLPSPRWTDYDLLDSGDGQKLERFGAHTFIRPEVQALWKKALPASRWQAADAVFQPSGEESGGHWKFNKAFDESWLMTYPLPQHPLRFTAMTTPGRHLGVFPECAAHWDWLAGLISRRDTTEGPTPRQRAQPLRLHRPGHPRRRSRRRAGHPRGCLQKVRHLGAPEPGPLRSG